MRRVRGRSGSSPSVPSVMPAITSPSRSSRRVMSASGTSGRGLVQLHRYHDARRTLAHLRAPEPDALPRPRQARLELVLAIRHTQERVLAPGQRDRAHLEALPDGHAMVRAVREPEDVLPEHAPHRRPLPQVRADDRVGHEHVRDQLVDGDGHLALAVSRTPADEARAHLERQAPHRHAPGGRPLARGSRDTRRRRPTSWPRRRRRSGCTAPPGRSAGIRPFPCTTSTIGLHEP